MTIGVLMAVNLLAAHGWRFKIQSSGLRLWAGLAVIVLGLLITAAVIAAGHNDRGFHAKPSFTWDAFWSVAVPLARPGFLTGAVLGFAHTVGEFGVVLMIGGNIPGETKVLSVAIYDYVETLQWTQAHILAGGMLVFSFAVILAMMLIEKRVGRPGA